MHLLASLRPVNRIADVVRDLKKDSTVWVREEFDGRFAWQEGYSAFSVSPSESDAGRRYIKNQEAHHAKENFVEELKRILEKDGIEYDEKYLL